MSLHRFVARNKVGRINPGGGGKRPKYEDQPGWDYRTQGNRSKKPRGVMPDADPTKRPRRAKRLPWGPKPSFDQSPYRRA